MKTLYEFLIDQETKKVNHKDLDKLATLMVKDARIMHGISDEQFKALFRFSSCLLHWMSEELNPDEITWVSFLKLVQCEIDKDGNKPTDEYTVFDILIDEAAENSPIIYQLYQFYRDYDQCMPNYNIIVDCIESASREFDIEFDKQITLAKVDAFQEEHIKNLDNSTTATEDEVCNETNSDYNILQLKLSKRERNIKLVKDTLGCLNDYLGNFDRNYFIEAKRIASKTSDLDLNTLLWAFFNYLDEFSGILEAVHDYIEDKEY